MVRGPSRTVKRNDVLEAMHEHGSPREPFTAKELADHLPCSKDTVYNRLRELLELGEVHTEKVGARARVWWSANSDTPTPAIDRTRFDGHDSKIISAALSSAGQPLTSAYIEEQTGLDSNIAYKRLRTLAENGWLESKKAGANARVWWLSHEIPEIERPV